MMTASGLRGGGGAWVVKRRGAAEDGSNGGPHFVSAHAIETVLHRKSNEASCPWCLIDRGRLGRAVTSERRVGGRWAAGGRLMSFER